MILDKMNTEELGKTFEECKTMTKVYLKCDYCSEIIYRLKAITIVIW
jgi:hypothetical protein